MIHLKKEKQKLNNFNKKFYCLCDKKIKKKKKDLPIQ